MLKEASFYFFIKSDSELSSKRNGCWEKWKMLVSASPWWFETMVTRECCRIELEKMVTEQEARLTIDNADLDERMSLLMGRERFDVWRHANARGIFFAKSNLHAESEDSTQAQAMRDFGGTPSVPGDHFMSSEACFADYGSKGFIQFDVLIIPKLLLLVWWLARAWESRSGVSRMVNNDRVVRPVWNNPRICISTVRIQRQSSWWKRRPTRMFQHSSPVITIKRGRASTPCPLCQVGILNVGEHVF